MSVPTPPPPGPGPTTGAGAGFAYPRPAIEAAARAATAAADQARTIDPGAPVRGLSAVLPGARSAAAGGELAVSWQRGMQGWCDDLARHAEALLGSSAATTGTDAGAAGSLGRTLFGGVLDPTDGH